MGESDYLDDNLMQKPFSGKEKHIFFFYSFLERKNPRFYDMISIEKFSPPECNRLPRSYLTKEIAPSSRIKQITNKLTLQVNRDSVSRESRFTWSVNLLVTWSVNL
jgi:hypothetical protein